jgi:hypothetical protein
MNWYLIKEGVQYGPFDSAAMQGMIDDGRLVPGDLVWQEGLAGWVPAGHVSFSWPDKVQAGASAMARTAPGTRPRKKKRRFGCLGCLGTMILIPAMLIGAVVLWVKFKDSDNMNLGSSTMLASKTMEKNGGLITVDSGGSRLNGMTVSVSDQAYTTTTSFKIKATPILDHKLGRLFNPATPLITIDNGHAYSNDPMVVKVPVAIAKDEFALGFFYDRHTGKLEGIPLITEDANSITMLTRHFSDLVITKAKKTEIINGLPADSGFRPGTDDWQFTNFGSWLAPGGHCAGQSVSAMWYYIEKRKAANERGLYGRYDNNDYGMGTIDLQEDDSWGYRFASVVQDELDWNNLTRKIMLKFEGFNSGLTWLAFAYSITLTGEPQYIGIRGQKADKDGKLQDVGHAMVVYKVDASGLYVADPNYPGNENRKIAFSLGSLSPYNSGENRAEIEKGNGLSFPVLLYIGKTAMADWGKIGARYSEIAAGTIGNDKFPKWNIKYLIKEGENKKWPEVPKVIETDEPTTMKPGEGYKGLLRFVVNFPYSNPQQYRVDIYKDTTIIHNGSFDADRKCYYNLALDKGVNNIGFYYYMVGADGGSQFIDFKRVKIIYGEDDLTGIWKGEMKARPTEVFRKFIEDGIVFVLKKFLPERSESDLRSAAAASITEHVATLPFTFTLTKHGQEKNVYDFVMEHNGEDGRPYRSTGKADYQEGTLIFRAKAADGSIADYKGGLIGKGAMKGSLSVNAWGIVNNAVTGEWHAEKAKP